MHFMDSCGIGMIGGPLIAQQCLKVFASMIFTSVSLVSTLWISHKISLKAEWSADKYPQNDDAVMRDIHVENESGGQLPIKEQLINTLQNEQQFELFMEHISNEFSSDLLLCFVECNQYKQMFANKQTTGEVHKFYKLYPAIPLSSLIHDHLDENINEERRQVVCMKKCALALYTKYIEVGSHYEINISSPLREKYSEIMDDCVSWMDAGNEETDIKEVIDLFDPIIEEMFHLMTQIYVRYIFK